MLKVIQKYIKTMKNIIYIYSKISNYSCKRLCQNISQCEKTDSENRLKCVFLETSRGPIKLFLE